MSTKMCNYEYIPVATSSSTNFHDFPLALTSSRFHHDKTVWAACRAVIFGCIIIVVGLAMTILGYFDKHFSERIETINGTDIISHDKMIQYQLKSMQYLGPILMGIGSFILIIACVVTLESRDKHAQIITEDAIIQKRKRILSEEKAEQNDVFIYDDEKDAFINQTLTNQPQSGVLSTNRLAPLADVDSLTDISITNRSAATSRLQSECAEQQCGDDQEANDVGDK